MARAKSDQIQPYAGPGAATESDSVVVEFISTRRYENGGEGPDWIAPENLGNARHKGPIFLEGYRYAFTEAFARKWIKRGAAFDVSKPRPMRDEDDENVIHEEFAPLQKGDGSEGVKFKPSELRQAAVGG